MCALAFLVLISCQRTQEDLYEWHRHEGFDIIENLEVAEHSWKLLEEQPERLLWGWRVVLTNVSSNEICIEALEYRIRDADGFLLAESSAAKRVEVWTKEPILTSDELALPKWAVRAQRNLKAEPKDVVGWIPSRNQRTFQSGNDLRLSALARLPQAIGEVTVKPCDPSWIRPREESN